MKKGYAELLEIKHKACNIHGTTVGTLTDIEKCILAVESSDEEMQMNAAYEYRKLMQKTGGWKSSCCENTR